MWKLVVKLNTHRIGAFHRPISSVINLFGACMFDDYKELIVYSNSFEIDEKIIIDW